MSLPQVNARLTKVAGGGTIEDYGEEAGTDTEKWTGSADAYYSEKLRRTLSQGPPAGGSDVLRESYVIIRADLVELEEGDTVTLEVLDTEETISREVKELRTARLPGVLSTTRAVLENG